MHARTLLVAALVAASTTLVACSSDNVLGLGVAGTGGPGTDPDTLNNARIRFVNATAVSLDVATGGVVNAGNGAIVFGTTSSCITTNATSPNLSVRISGTNTTVPTFTPGYQIGVNYTVIAYPGSGSGIRFATLNDTFTPPSGESGFRVFNGDNVGTSYDVYVTAPGVPVTAASPAAPSVLSGTASTFSGVSTTVNQRVSITPAGSKSVILDVGNVAFVAGLNITLVIAPPLPGSATPRTFLAASC